MHLDPQAEAAGVKLIAHDAVGSTNAEAIALARVGERGPLWVTARSQSAGRGRRGAPWVSEPGNLYASLLVTGLPPARAPELAFVSALAVHDAIGTQATQLPLTLKWPNDVLLAGAKVAGILIEGEGGPPLAVAVGIGVNCISHPSETAYPATDLAAAGMAVMAETLFAGLSGAMLRRLAQWNAGAGFAQTRADWLARASGVGEPIRVRLPDRELDGHFAGLDASGHLLLEQAGGAIEAIAAGEVQPLNARGA
ncbi:MAG TPA: biotin--[acetyl-CoA-carboxylase] ligase [Pseudolabrys sp.]|nr:biotin--[acetyl-CoA-carboxylase] ligase [Pseudolabrys sp.]